MKYNIYIVEHPDESVHVSASTTLDVHRGDHRIYECTVFGAVDSGAGGGEPESKRVFTFLSTQRRYAMTLAGFSYSGACFEVV